MRRARSSVSRAVSVTALGLLVCVPIIGALVNLAEMGDALRAALWALLGVALVVMARGENPAREPVEDGERFGAAWSDIKDRFEDDPLDGRIERVTRLPARCAPP